MTDTTDILHNEGLEGVEKHFNKKLFIVELICWIIFITFIFASYFGLEKAHECERKDTLIKAQSDSLKFYKKQAIAIQDSLNQLDFAEYIHRNYILQTKLEEANKKLKAKQ